MTDQESKHRSADCVFIVTSEGNKEVVSSDWACRSRAACGYSLVGRRRETLKRSEGRGRLIQYVSACTCVNKAGPGLLEDGGGGVEWLCRRSAPSREIGRADLCPCIENKKKKMEAAKRATRKLGQVLKDHCSPFSPGLRCIQNCNLTVAPSISSAFLFYFPLANCHPVALPFRAGKR